MRKFKIPTSMYYSHLKRNRSNSIGLPQTSESLSITYIYDLFDIIIRLVEWHMHTHKVLPLSTQYNGLTVLPLPYFRFPFLAPVGRIDLLMFVA